MTGIDFSFLRLVTDFAQAKADKMTDSEYFYNGSICLHPLEKYLQITNSPINIAFDDSYKVELINCAGNVLLDITTKVFINEFQDNNGIYQIAFEIAPINQSFYEKTYLKFTHLGSDLVLYSNGFIISDEYDNNSFRLDYKSYGIYKGTNYVLADFYQSIRIIGYFEGLQEKKDSKIYTEINGKIRKSRVIQSFESSFNIDWIDTFVYERLAVALENNLVYLNGVRIENLEDLKAGQRKGKSNLFEANFKVQFDETDTYTDVFQIAPPLEIITLSPLDIYTLATIPATGEAVFNYNISFGGSLKLYNFNTDALLHTISVVVSGNVFSFNMPTLSNGKYYFLFENVTNYLGMLKSITNKNEWSFEIADGEYDSSDYDGNNYLTD
jgi:hypothetical protein